MNILSCNNLSVSYDRPVLENITFEVKKGDFVCIVGENGSGKTTLIKTILGLHQPKGGTLYKNADTPIGYVPQKLSVYHDFPASSEEVVRSGISSAHPFFTKKEKALVQEAMQKLNITALARKCFCDLSGGQQQRVLIARAFCASNQFLVLDEPFSGLDPLAVSELYSALKQLNKNENTTILMVSHDMQSSVKIATKILHIDKTVRFFGAPHDYICSECGKKFIGGSIND